MGTRSKLELQLEMLSWFLKRGENQSNRRKTSRSREENYNKQKKHHIDAYERKSLMSVHKLNHCFQIDIKAKEIY